MMLGAGLRFFVARTNGSRCFLFAVATAQAQATGEYRGANPHQTHHGQRVYQDLVGRPRRRKIRRASCLCEQNVLDRSLRLVDLSTTQSYEPMMSRLYLLVGSLFLAVGCNLSASLVLKTPVANQCTKAGLQGCDQLTEGLLLFLDGEKDEGLRLVTDVAAKNPPEKVRKYVAMLRTLESAPGAKKFVEPLDELLDVLQSSTGPGATPSRKKGTSTNAVAVIEEVSPEPSRVVTAPTDLHRARFGTALAPRYSNPRCEQLFGKQARCGAIVRGPLIVTDLRSIGRTCEQQTIAVIEPDGTTVTLDGPLAIHGARIPLLDDQMLVLVRRSANGQRQIANKATETEQPTPSESVPCELMWSAYVPYELSLDDSELENLKNRSARPAKDEAIGF